MTVSGILLAGDFHEGFASCINHGVELPKPYNQLPTIGFSM